MKGERGEIHTQFQILKHLLPNYRPYFREQIYNANLTTNTEFDLSYGLAIFVKNSIDTMVTAEGDHMIFGSKHVGHDTTLPSPRNIQYITLNNGIETLNIFNFHGIWIKNATKDDQPERIVQSKNIVSFLQNFEGKILLTGDFNLLPDTLSLRIIQEELNLKNLVIEYDINSTRSALYPYEDSFADYSFVSPSLNVSSFVVPQTEASDHLPLIIDVDF